MDKSIDTSPGVKVRMPAVLVPAYNALMKTPDGSKALKRIKVGCGICKSTKYYGITRGVTRVASVIACENCRHFYQKIRREPVSLNCIAEDKSSCYRENTFLDTKCKACWVMRLLDCCPHETSVYETISKLLGPECREGLRGNPILPEELFEDDKGSLALEVKKNDVWAPAPSGDDTTGFEITDSMSGNGDSNSSDLFEKENEPNQISENLVSDELMKDLNMTLLPEEYQKDICSNLSKKDDLIGITNETIHEVIEKQSSKNTFENLSLNLLRDSSKETTSKPTDKITANKALSKNVPVPSTNCGLNRSSRFQETQKPNQSIVDSSMHCTATSVTRQDFDDVDMEEDEEAIDDPASMELGTVTRRRKESNDEENGFAKKSERIKRKRKKVEYFNKPVERTGRRMIGLVHGPNGALLKNGKDLCDCLQEDCPGCHFPCPKCRSPKCGNECRVNRRWYYERIEVEGTKICFINKFAPKI